MCTTSQTSTILFYVNISRQTIFLWVGLCGNGTFIGPCFFEGNLNGERYLQMINEEAVPHLQEHFDQQQCGGFRRLWWIQDGAPAHLHIIVKDRPRELFNRIALNHDPEWPWLNPIWFFFFGYLKSKVFRTEEESQLRWMH